MKKTYYRKFINKPSVDYVQKTWKNNRKMQLENVKIAFAKEIFLRKPESLNTTALYHYFCHGWTNLADLIFLCAIHRPHADAAYSVGLLWTSDRPVAPTSTWQHTILTRGGHPRPRQDSNPQSQHASGLRPRGHWDRPYAISASYLKFLQLCYARFKIK